MFHIIWLLFSGALIGAGTTKAYYILRTGHYRHNWSPWSEPEKRKHFSGNIYKYEDGVDHIQTRTCYFCGEVEQQIKWRKY